MDEKIEQEAEKYAKGIHFRGSMSIEHCKLVFIDGAKFAHNAALSEAIEKMKEKGFDPEDYNGKKVFEILEGLKIKP